MSLPIKIMTPLQRTILKCLNSYKLLVNDDIFERHVIIEFISDDFKNRDIIVTDTLILISYADYYKQLSSLYGSMLKDNVT